MNITKEQADKVIAALSMNRIMARDENGNYTKEITAQVVVEALSIMRGLAEDAEPEHSSQNIAIKLLRDRVELARKFPTNTCPASRHLHLIAEHLASGKPYPMLQEEPEHCAETMLSVLESLWNARNKLAATSPQAAQTEADELLRKWNLDPDLYRTDSGALNHMKIAAALKHPDDYPHTAQTAVKSESLAQAAQALAQPPSEGKTIEALAPTEAALREVVRLSEDAGLYDADFQTEAQEREAFDTWFDSTPHGEPSYQETFSAGYQAGRAGSKP